MALTVAQYESILEVLREVPLLVDELESRHTGFGDDVLGWLKRAEQAMTANRLPAASQLASERAQLIEAGRGVLRRDLTIIGRPSVRKIKDATAARVLASATDILHGVIAERQAVFQDADRVARQVLAIARTKGLLTEQGDSGSRQRFLEGLRDRLVADPDLAGVYTHIVGIVGTTDALVVLDRGLASIV